MRFRIARTSPRRQLAAFLSVLCGVAALNLGTKSTPTPYFEHQMTAARHMRACLDSLGSAQAALFPDDDIGEDPNRTGVIGVEYSPITTTLGNLVAKRTSTNPDFAALLVRWFHQLGVHEGDIVAVGCSGSFPALALATICATEATQLRPVIIPSLGASSFGANRPEWTYLDMETVLYEKGIIHHRSAAASLGGAEDIGADLSVESRALLREAVHLAGIPLIHQADAVHNIQERAIIYQKEGIPTVFVNIGGAQINVGDYAQVRRLSVGLNRPERMAEAPTESMVAYFAGLGVPTIHLLNIEQTALEYGLGIDPRPLAEPGLSTVYYVNRVPPGIWIFAATCILAGWIVLIRPRRRLSPGRPCQSAPPGRGESATDRPAPHR